MHPSERCWHERPGINTNVYYYRRTVEASTLQRRRLDLVRWVHCTTKIGLGRCSMPSRSGHRLAWRRGTRRCARCALGTSKSNRAGLRVGSARRRPKVVAHALNPLLPRSSKYTGAAGNRVATNREECLSNHPVVSSLPRHRVASGIRVRRPSKAQRDYHQRATNELARSRRKSRAAIVRSWNGASYRDNFYSTVDCHVWVWSSGSVQRKPSCRPTHGRVRLHVVQPATRASFWCGHGYGRCVGVSLRRRGDSDQGGGMCADAGQRYARTVRAAGHNGSTSTGVFLSV
jgi:hypothetical protein